MASLFISPVAIVASVLLLCFADSSLAAERPNFLFVLTDDQSYGMMGCDGNELTKTPNIDQLARQSVFFDRAYVTSAICMPSRVSIFLSQYERKHGVNFNSGTSIADEAWEKSYPMVLRQNGYYTGYVGKNHSPIGKGGYESGVMEKSFDYFYAGHGHIRFYPKDHHEIFQHAVKDTQVEIVSEGAVDFLSNEHRLKGAVRFLESRPADKPFCLSICLNLPHGAGTREMQQRDSDDGIYKSLYRDLEIPLPKYFIAKDDITSPRLPTDLLRAKDRQSGYLYVNTVETAKEQITRQMQAMTGIDRLIGQLRQKLAETKQADNTVIVFCSDHGLFMGEHGLGGKALCYEKTTHVPMIVFDPELPQSQRGRRSDALVQSIDIAATLLDYAGIARPAEFQGKSLKALVSGDQTPVRSYVFTENLWSTHFGNPRIEAVQDKRWKYIRYYRNNTLSASEKVRVAKAFRFPAGELLYGVNDNGMARYRHNAEASLRGEEPVYEELYDIASDPDELTNLINQPQHAGELERLRGAWKQELTRARGRGFPKVDRYTVESKRDKQ